MGLSIVCILVLYALPILPSLVMGPFIYSNPLTCDIDDKLTLHHREEIGVADHVIRAFQRGVVGYGAGVFQRGIVGTDEHRIFPGYLSLS